MPLASRAPIGSSAPALFGRAETSIRSGSFDASIAALGAALGDLADLLDAVVVGGDPGVVFPAAPGAKAAPDLAERPFPKQVLGQVDLVVAVLSNPEMSLKEGR